MCNEAKAIIDKVEALIDGDTSETKRFAYYAFLGSHLSGLCGVCSK